MNKKIYEDPALGQGDDVINYSKLILIAFTPNLNICFKGLLRLPDKNKIVDVYIVHMVYSLTI